MQPGTHPDMPTSENPAALLARLQDEAANTHISGPLPERLPVAAIKQLPELFQPRGQVIDELHVRSLVKAITIHGTLDPVQVIQIGDSAYLIDGHHRLEAYSAAGFSDSVPVAYFRGSPEDAVLEAGRANSKAKLVMSNQDRQDYAWRLVCMGEYSKQQIQEAASISDGQVGNMRRVQKQLGERATDYNRWWAAREAARGLEGREWTEDEWEARKRDKATALAEKLRKAWGPMPQAVVAAMALEEYFGRRLEDLFDHLREMVPEGYDEVDDMGF